MDTEDQTQRFLSAPGGLGWHGTDEKWSDSVCVLNFIISEKVVMRGQGMRDECEDFGLKNCKAAVSNTRDEKGCGQGRGRASGN